MGDSYSNITKEENSFNVSNMTNSHEEASRIFSWIIISVGLPLTLVAIFAVFSLVRRNHVAPIYVINLLMSDLIQLCSVVVVLINKNQTVSFFMYYLSLMASVGFMVCIALERYLVIAWPLWYRFRHSVRISVMICVVVWLLPLIYLLPHYLKVDFKVKESIFAVFLLLPCPLLILSLAGTLKALSAACSVPTDEKRRIVALLVLVLLTYILLFLPSAIWSLAEKARKSSVYTELSYNIVLFSPLVDAFLYVLLRKGAVDKVLASLCCCKMESNDINRSTQFSAS